MEGMRALVLLAQDEVPPQRPEGLFGNTLFMVLLCLAVIYFFLIRPQKKEADAKKKLLEALKKNDRVITTGGMYGTIVNLKEDEITLRVDDQAKVKIRLLKSSIARVVSKDNDAGSADDSKKS